MAHWSRVRVGSHHHLSRCFLVRFGIAHNDHPAARISGMDPLMALVRRHPPVPCSCYSQYETGVNSGIKECKLRAPPKTRWRMLNCEHNHMIKSSLVLI